MAESRIYGVHLVVPKHMGQLSAGSCLVGRFAGRRHFRIAAWLSFENRLKFVRMGAKMGKIMLQQVE